MEHRDASWIFGQDGVEEPCDMVTNRSGQNIAVDCDLTIKVFDNSGNFEKCFRIPAFLADNKNIRNSLKNRGCLEYILYIAFMLIVYTLMVSDSDIIGFIPKLDGNSEVSSRQSGMQTGQCNKLFSWFPTKAALLLLPPRICHQWQQNLTRIEDITNSSVTSVSVILVFVSSK